MLSKKKRENQRIECTQMNRPNEDHLTRCDATRNLVQTSGISAPPKGVFVKPFFAAQMPKGVYPNVSCRYRAEISGFNAVYKGASILRKSTPLGPYCRPMPRVLGGSCGGGRVRVGEVPLQCALLAKSGARGGVR